MQDYNKDFKDYIETLPPELKQAVYSIDYHEKLQEIIKNNKLMVDQAGKLEAETSLIIMGVEPLDKYVANLVKNVGLSNIQASIVAHDVNESIFKNIRESLKKINDQIKKEEKIIEEINILNKEYSGDANNPTKEDVLAGIEHPEDIKNNEESISMSSLKSNGINQEKIETMERGVEIRVDNLPEIAPEAILPVVSSLTPKKQEPFHVNIPPVKNIVESKLNNTVVVPKQTIVVEEKTKLPNKPKTAGDPYREPIV